MKNLVCSNAFSYSHVKQNKLCEVLLNTSRPNETPDWNRLLQVALQ